MRLRSTIFFFGLGIFCLLITCAPLSLCNFAIGAFNVQVFGVTKMQNPDVVAVLVQIFRRYDIGLIQEIRGHSTSFNVILGFFSCCCCCWIF